MSMSDYFPQMSRITTINTTASYLPSSPNEQKEVSKSTARNQVTNPETHPRWTSTAADRENMGNGGGAVIAGAALLLISSGTLVVGGQAAVGGGINAVATSITQVNSGHVSAPDNFVEGTQTQLGDVEGSRADVSLSGGSEANPESASSGSPDASNGNQLTRFEKILVTVEVGQLGLATGGLAAGVISYQKEEESPSTTRVSSTTPQPKIEDAM